MTRRIGLLSLAGIVAAAVLVLGWWWLAGTHRAQAPGAAHTEPLAVRVAKGAYLARAGNCMNCHTRQGGEPYAGGRSIESPFGIVYSSNLTPDRTHGIGNWTSVDFWRALHEGRAPGGRLLYPAFPYTSFTQVNQDDADALFAYLRSLPAVRQPNRDHAMRWPYDSQLALAAWRSLYFTPAVFQKDVTHDEQWNRGAYLVRGLGHCNACHASRNLLGAVDDRLALAGGTMPMNNWYAPSLLQPTEATLHRTIWLRWRYISRACRRRRLPAPVPPEPRHRRKVQKSTRPVVRSATARMARVCPVRIPRSQAIGRC